VNKTEFESRIIAMQDVLYRVSVTILREPKDREDAIQECILKAIVKREKLKDDRAMQAWVIRILINECYAILRKNRRMIPLDKLPEREAENGGDPEVFRMLFSLPDKLRLPMVLYYVEGYSTEEIAKMLSVPAGTVRSRLTRGREKLKTMMESEEAATV